MGYLTPSDAALFGVPSASFTQIQQASMLIDAYCGRARQGLVWVAGADGLPCYMLNAVPDYTYVAISPIAPGSNVVVQVQSTPLPADIIGKPLVLDKGTATATEFCIVVAVNSVVPGNLTLETVQFAHAAKCTLDDGIQVLEERFLPDGRAISRLSHFPIVRITAALGRYSYGRRSDQIAGNFVEANLLSIVQTFGGPPPWLPMDVNQVAFNNGTGEIWVPAGQLLAYYTDLRIFYCAGWPSTMIPAPIKQACANIIANNIQTSGVSSLFRLFKSGDTSMERFANESLDDDTKRTLKPYCVRAYT